MVSAAALLVLGLLRADAAGASAAKAIRLSGRVTRPDGRPAAGATVALLRFREDALVTRADAQGRYTVLLPSRFGTLVEASLPGIGVSKTLPVRPAPGQTRIRLDVPLRPIPVLTGTVFLPNGKPAADIALDSQVLIGQETCYPSWLHPPWPTTGSEAGAPPMDTRTDAQGRYRWPLVLLEHDVFTEGSRYHICLVSPRGLGWAELSDIEVDLDKPVLRRDIHLQAGERITGQVVAYPGGAGRAGVKVEGRVLMAIHWSPAFAQAVTDAEGRFAFAAALPPKNHEVAIQPGEGWGIMAMQQRPGSAAGATEVRILLVQDYAVEGKVFRPDGQPLANADFTISFQGLRPQANGQTWEGSSNAGDFHTDAGGRYSFTRQASGEPWGEGPMNDGYLLLAARAPGVGVAAPLVVDATTPPPHVANIHLEAPGRVTGRVVQRANGRPAEGIWVEFGPVLPGFAMKDPTTLGEPFFDKQASEREGSTPGRFNLRGVAPGTYLLEVRGHAIRELSARNGRALTITVAPGETLDLGDIVTDSGPSFSGRLSGGPSTLEGYEVKCILWPSGDTGEAREAEVRMRPDRSYTVWAYERAAGRYDGFILAQKETRRYVSHVFRGLDLSEAAPVTGVELSLSDGATVSGRLTGADGRAVIEGAVVVRPLGGEALALEAREVEDRGGINVQMQVAVDKQGRFLVTGLLPGRYELRATWPRGCYGEPKPVTLQLTEGEHRTLGVVKASRRPPG